MLFLHVVNKQWTLTSIPLTGIYGSRYSRCRTVTDHFELLTKCLDYGWKHISMHRCKPTSHTSSFIVPARYKLWQPSALILGWFRAFCAVCWKFQMPWVKKLHDPDTFVYSPQPPPVRQHPYISGLSHSSHLITTLGQDCPSFFRTAVTSFINEACLWIA